MRQHQRHSGHKLNRRKFTAASLGAIATSGLASTLIYGQETGAIIQDEDAQPREAEFERDYEAPDFKPKWKNEQVNRQMAQDFVIYAHSNLDKVKMLLEREPGLLNASIDWGAGDFETALGGASHMGRKDIAKFLISKGARIDLFCATMLGMLNTVKEMLNYDQNLIDAKGPHGFSLHWHAQVGQEDAKPVLDYLQSIKEIELRPIPFLKKKEVDKG